MNSYEEMILENRRKRQIKDIGKCIALRRAGWSIRKIAFEFNVVEQTVVKCLRENGVA